MRRSSRQGTFDVAVVGSGLAGLTAAVRLQRAGRRVLILERRARPGGLCGTHRLDGYEFVIACNDFGLGMAREMRELGVAAPFFGARTRLHLDGGVVDVPPSARALLRLFPRIGDVARLIRGLRGADRRFLGPLVEGSVKCRSFADLIESLAYPLGVPPRELGIEVLKAEFSRHYGYGYHRPTIPAGGPRALVERIVERFQALGGTLALENECLAVRSLGEAGKVVVATGDSYAAKAVVSSQGRWGDYPDDCRPGLAVSVFHIAARKSLPYPEGVHTAVHLPSGIGHWLWQIDCGEWPPAFGFHVFRSDLPERSDHYALNVYLYLPRGVERPGPEQLRRVEGYVFDRLEAMLPGLASNVLYKRFVCPAEFRELHGLSSRVVELRAKPGVPKPDVYDPRSDIYHVGNSVLPPGEHAGAAVLSGRRAAEAVMRAQRPSARAPSGAVRGGSGGRPPA